MPKNKNKIIILSSVIVLLVAFIINLYGNDSKYVLESNKLNKNVSNMLTMMYETDVDGVYSPVTDGTTEWISDKYFNPSLSGCEHGGIVDYKDNKVQMESSYTDKCYVYFSNNPVSGDSENDNKEEEYHGQSKNVDYLNVLFDYYDSEYFDYISSLNLVLTNGALLYHDSNLSNGAGDNSYRYSGYNPNNWICFGYDRNSYNNECASGIFSSSSEYAYRIIGIFYVNALDEQASVNAGTDIYTLQQLIKIIKYTPYNNTQYRWLVDVSNKWSDSTLNTSVLNGTYLTTINGYGWEDFVATPTWNVGGMAGKYGTAKSSYNQEMVTQGPTIQSHEKIGLMYISDYGYAASSNYWTTQFGTSFKNYDWLYLENMSQWSISRNSTKSWEVLDIYNNANIDSADGYNYSFYARPTLYLDSSVNILSGDGTINSPYILSL